MQPVGAEAIDCRFRTIDFHYLSSEINADPPLQLKFAEICGLDELTNDRVFYLFEKNFTFPERMVVWQPQVGNGNARVDLARYRPVGKPFLEPAGTEFSDIALPVGLGLLSVFQFLLKLGQAEIPVFGQLQFRGGSADLASRLYEQLPSPAGFALIAPSFKLVAMRAFAFDIAVGQKSAAGGAVVLLYGLLLDVSLLKQR